MICSGETADLQNQINTIAPGLQGPPGDQGPVGNQGPAGEPDGIRKKYRPGPKTIRSLPEF